MIAAIYARKSTTQTGVDDEAKSVARQIENAKSFAVEHGWTVEPQFVFSDDAISGAETRKLKARQRLFDVIHGGKPPFDVLIMREESRFSRRDGDEAFGELKKIARAGVAIWFYQDRTTFRYGSFESNVTGMLKGEFAAEFRRAIAKHTYESHLQKARAGHVTGGKTFGYDNTPVNGHKEHRINDAEAAIVRDIYERYAEGHGYRAIAHALNEQHVPTPRAQRGRPDGWDCGTIRDVLQRPLYRGLIVWNRSKKRNDEGEQHQTDRPESDWITVEAPHLRIIDERLAATVDARRGDRRERYLNATKGQQPRPAGGKYLLSGMLRCPCGSNFEAQKPAHGQRPGSVYVCAAHRRKGPAVCASTIALPIAETDAAVLNRINSELLTPGYINRLLDTVDSLPDENRAAIATEVSKLDNEITTVIALAKSGGDVDELGAELKTLNRRRAELRRKLAEPTERPDREQLRQALQKRVKEWRTILRSHPAQARQVLQQFVGTITVSSRGHMVVAYDVDNERIMPGFPLPDEAAIYANNFVNWTASIKPAGLLEGLESLGNALVQRMASPTGSEPNVKVGARFAA